MIRKHKIYSRPRKLYDLVRIGEENKLVERYGLKSKREIWKAVSAIARIRRQAKMLITKSHEEQKILFNRLNKMGLKVNNIADVLGLGKEDFLKRRLQSIIVGKIARTPKGARQLIVHKHIAINNKIINIPSYIVPVDEEDKIEIVRAAKIKELTKGESKLLGEIKNV
jgi:small subunit ribosomal protein S4